MLYRGSEITREVAWVIFDEIHYLRDKGEERERFVHSKSIWSFYRTWCYMGRNYYSSTRQCSLCLSFGNDTQCETIR